MPPLAVMPFLSVSNLDRELITASSVLVPINAVKFHSLSVLLVSPKFNLPELLLFRGSCFRQGVVCGRVN